MARMKASNLIVTEQYLSDRADRLTRIGYSTPKWINFCELMLQAGLKVKLYEARRTVSKYVTVSNNCGKEFKVRFSNHKPIKAREVGEDCDFFVGVTNLSVTNTNQATKATLAYFGLESA